MDRATPPAARTSRNAPPPPVETLRRLYVTEGLTVTEVAERLDLPQRRVTAALQAAGIPRRRPGWTDGAPPSPITAQQLGDLYVEHGNTVREVAAVLGTTTTRVNAALRRHGIARRPEPAPPPPPLALDAATLTDLYVTRRLDDTTIGTQYSVPSWRVTRRRRELGVHRPASPPPHPDPPVMPPAKDLHRWYVTEGRTLEQIAHHHHTARDTVRAWLQTAGIPIQPRTSREHRKHLDPELLRDLYQDREWSATMIAAELDTSIQQVLRTLHEHGIPVRRGGAPSQPDNAHALQRLTALYQDPDVVALLREHHIPERPMAGTITQRFPTPALITRTFLAAGLHRDRFSCSTYRTTHRTTSRTHPAPTPPPQIPVRHTLARSPWLQRQQSS